MDTPPQGFSRSRNSRGCLYPAQTPATAQIKKLKKENEALSQALDDFATRLEKLEKGKKK
jgi:hypothetical protein